MNPPKRFKPDKAATEEAPRKAAQETEAEEAPQEPPPRLPNLFWALAPILSMAGLMLYVFGRGADAGSYDAAHLPLLCSIVVACAVGMAYGRSFKFRTSRRPRIGMPPRENGRISEPTVLRGEGPKKRSGMPS